MKRFKLLCKSGKIHILHWESQGVLFGPQWHCIATFDKNEENDAQCRQLIVIMNKCDINTNDDDRN